MRKLILAVSALTLAVPAMPSAAIARSYDYQQHRVSKHDRNWRAHDDRRGYDSRRHDSRRYCKKPDGTTGLLIGGAAGVLAGRAIDTRGDRTTGTVLGAALGALLGRHVERNVADDCR
jgi:hypothetical protein